MTSGKTSAAVLGLVGGIVLGAWVGTELTMDREAAVRAPVAATIPAVAEPAAQAKTTLVTRIARAASSGAAVNTPAPESAPKLVMTIPVSAPELHQRMKPVLARGTKLPLAVEGFMSAEQFATIAHAARNTQVPFILLKYRVLTEGQTLENALLASKPDLDAHMEAVRAREEAKSDIRALTTTNFVSSN
ncbi:MAG: hypothetical protein ABI983_05360 [Acidobacteriota bacterium]